ncbi:MAG: O-antigen ligase [Patescibacteria group bacterium]|jgi:O-antigen ligase|nr:O-antigen ligase [Patescibacteria group bacterium]
MNLINKKFRLAFAFIFLFEVFSLFAYLFSEFNVVVFLAIVLFVFVISLKNIEYGLWFSFVELIIGSKGYLFYVSIFSFSLSIRIGIWLAVMLAFFIKISLLFYKKYLPDIKKGKVEIKAFLKESVFDNQFLKYYFYLFAFVFFSLFIAVIKGNNIKNIFLDFNAWIFLSYIFPVYYVYFKNSTKINSLYSIILAAITWVTVKTFFLLYIFSHNILSVIPTIYLWVRKTGVGEITRMDGGFSRIFFQSHIYFLPLFFVFLGILLFIIFSQKEKASLEKITYYWFFVSAFLMAINLITFSRSNWVGLLFGLFIVFLYILIVYKFKKTLIFLLSFFLISVLSLFLITATVKFPFPSPNSNFNTANLLSERAKQISGEAGVSSRWALLKPLLNEIKESPIVGAGFGKTVTYVSSDPRVLENSPDGVYETFAFEWGWLDLWLKLGILGVLFYLYFLYKILSSIFLNKNISNNFDSIFNLSLALGLFLIIIVNFFSPYLNHPLGFGYLIFVTIVFENFLIKN